MSPVVFASRALVGAVGCAIVVFAWLAVCVGAEQGFRLHPAVSWTLFAVPPAIAVWTIAYTLAVLGP